MFNANVSAIDGRIWSNISVLQGEIATNRSEILAAVQTNRTADKGLLGNFSILAQSIIPDAINPAVVVAPNSTGRSNLTLFHLDFPNAEGVRYNATVTVIMPANWAGGLLNFTDYWTSTAGNGDIVYWDHRARCSVDQGALDGPWGNNVTVADTVGTQGTTHIAPVASLVKPWGSTGGESICTFQVSRPSGGLAADAHYLGMKVWYVVT